MQVNELTVAVEKLENESQQGGEERCSTSSDDDEEEEEATTVIKKDKIEIEQRDDDDELAAPKMALLNEILSNLEIQKQKAEHAMKEKVKSEEKITKIINIIHKFYKEEIQDHHGHLHILLI